MSLPAHVTATLSAGPEDVVRPSIWVGGTMTARLQLLDDRREPVAAEGVTFLFRRPDGVEIIMPGASSDGTNRPPFWLAALEIDQGGAWAVRGRSTLPLRQLDWVTFDAVVGPVAPGAPASALWLQQDGAAQVTAEGGLLSAARIDLLPDAADPAGMALPGILPDGQSAKLPVALLRADARQVAGAEAERKAEELIPQAVQEPARAAARDEVQPLVQEAAGSAASAGQSKAAAEEAQRVALETAEATRQDALRTAQERVAAESSAQLASGSAAAALAGAKIYSSVQAGLDDPTVPLEGSFNVLAAGARDPVAYRKTASGAVYLVTHASKAALDALPAQAATAPGWVLVLLDSLRNIGAGLSDDWRQWIIAGLRTALQADGRVQLSPDAGGAALTLSPDGTATLGAAGSAPMISTTYLAALLTGDREALAMFRRDGGAEIAGWTLRPDGSLQAPSGRVPVKQDGAADFTFNGVRLRATSAPGMALVFLHEDGTWASGITTDGKWIGAGAEQEAPAPTISNPLQDQTIRPVDRDLMPVACRLDASQGALPPGTYTSATYFRTLVFPRGASRLRAVLMAHQLIYNNGEKAAENPYRAQASIKIGGEVYPFTWDGGATERYMEPGKVAASDELPVYIPPGGSAVLRTYCAVDALGKTWPLGKAAVAALGEGVIAGANHVATPRANLPALDASGNIAAPALLLGRTDTAAFPAICSYGSSSFDGTGDTPEAPTYELGYSSRAFHALGIPFVRHTLAGSTISTFLASGAGFYRRQTAIRSNAPWISWGLGSNDLPSISSLEAMQDRILRVLAYAQGAGKRVLWWNYTPRVTGAFTSLAAQVPDASDPIRLATNAWLAGLTHPALVGVVDVASVLADPSDPSRWRTDGGAYTGDGLHPNQRGHRTAAEGTQARIATILGV